MTGFEKHIIEAETEQAISNDLIFNLYLDFPRTADKQDKRKVEDKVASGFFHTFLSNAIKNNNREILFEGNEDYILSISFLKDYSFKKKFQLTTKVSFYFIRFVKELFKEENSEIFAKEFTYAKDGMNIRCLIKYTFAKGIFSINIKLYLPNEILPLSKLVSYKRAYSLIEKSFLNKDGLILLNGESTTLKETTYDSIILQLLEFYKEKKVYIIYDSEKINYTFTNHDNPRIIMLNLGTFNSEDFTNSIFIFYELNDENYKNVINLANNNLVFASLKSNSFFQALYSLTTHYKLPRNEINILKFIILHDLVSETREKLIPVYSVLALKDELLSKLQKQEAKFCPQAVYEPIKQENIVIKYEYFTYLLGLNKINMESDLPKKYFEEITRASHYLISKLFN